MPILQWDNALNIGLAHIDEQHRQLVGMLNRLHDAMNEGAEQRVLRELLTELSAYTVQHFIDEETHMRNVGFAGLAEHEREHERLKKQVAEYQQKVEANEAEIGDMLMDFLSDWLMDHIEGMDQEIPVPTPEATSASA